MSVVGFISDKLDTSRKPPLSHMNDRNIRLGRKWSVRTRRESNGQMIIGGKAISNIRLGAIDNTVTCFLISQPPVLAKGAERQQ